MLKWAAAAPHHPQEDPMKSFAAIVPVVCVAVLSGCGVVAKYLDAPFAPPVPAFLEDKNKECVNGLLSAYNRAPEVTAKGQTATSQPVRSGAAGKDCFAWATADHYSKQQIRDIFADQTLAEIDSNYVRFFKLHYERRAAGDMIFDFLNLGAGFTGTLAGGTFDKTVTNALVTLITGTKLAEQSNFYNKQASLAIIAKMDAMRADRRKAIELNLGHTNPYPLRSLMGDLNDYYRAGTVIEALCAINQAADTEKKEKEDALRSQRAPTQPANVPDERK
jgi:hypothetical protein